MQTDENTNDTIICLGDDSMRSSKSCEEVIYLPYSSTTAANNNNAAGAKKELTPAL